MGTIQRKVHTLFHTPRILQKKLVGTPIFPLLSDKTALKIQFKNVFLRDLDLENPQTFNEKIQWLKLYNRNPQYTQMVDKYAAKAYVAKIIGEEYIIPTLGVWDSFEDIDFDALPNQFVLKCTHGSGDVVICTDKENLDKEAAREKLTRALHTDFYKIGREWPYKNVPRKILAEQYMVDRETAELRDYKFFCFNGAAKALLIATERQKQGTEVKFDFFDMDFQHLPFRQGHPNADVLPAKPKRFDEMRILAEKLSRDLPHIRVDFYEANGKVYFGELTFSHFGGMVAFEPETWDYTFGNWITLPKTK